MAKVYVVFQMGQFGGVMLNVFKLKSDAEDYICKERCQKPKDHFRLEEHKVK